MKWFSVSVFLFVVGKCFSMSHNELQDFSIYLKETSLLDQPLKKNPADENDEDDPIADNAWEQSGRFEGDLILNDKQRQLVLLDVAEGLSRNAIRDGTKRWPDNEVIYYINKEHYTEDQVQAILNGIDDITRSSCIKFRPYQKGDRDAVVVQVRKENNWMIQETGSELTLHKSGSRRGCFSQVGYQGGFQILNLSARHPAGRGCLRPGTIVHEFLHTLGFYHMQSSPDRDDYVDIMWENILERARHNFRKYNIYAVGDFGVGYDYDSLMHYGPKSFSSNGRPTIVPKKGGVSIGQRIALSDKDTAKLNKMYCDADSDISNDGEAAPKPTIKKKKPKNKPFDGHGIGYHQGKTVAIKLPAAETYRLPDTPSYQVFDYFSKAPPQAMSPTLVERFGVGKEITYSYTLPELFKTYAQEVPPSYSNLSNNGIKPENENIDNIQEIEIKPQPEVKSSRSEETTDGLDEKIEKVEKTKTGRQDFHETLKKIGEVIKDRIHPHLYKPNTDYSEFYIPVKNRPVTTKTDYYLNYVPSSKGGSYSSDYVPKDVKNLKQAQMFISTLSGERLRDSMPIKKPDHVDYNKHEIKRKIETETEEAADDEPSAGEVDLTYGKVYPREKFKDIKSIYSLNPEYMSLKYLQNKQDYSNYYNPNDRNKGNPGVRNAQYTILGEHVPVTADWPKNYKDQSVRQSKIHDLSNYRSNSKEVDKSSSEEESSSEIFEPKVSVKRQLKRPVNKEHSSYEVTQSLNEKVETATEKANSDTHELSIKHDLEDRLHKILEGYTTFDNFDITSPYSAPEYDDTSESHEKEESSDDSAEAEY